MNYMLSKALQEDCCYMYFLTEFKNYDKKDLSEEELELVFKKTIDSNEQFQELLVYGVENLKENLTEEQFNIVLTVLKSKKESEFKNCVYIFKEFNQYLTEEQEEEIFQVSSKTGYKIKPMLYDCYYLLTKKQRKILIDNMISHIKSCGFMFPENYFTEEFLSFSDEERELISDCFFKIEKEVNFLNAIKREKINRCMTIKLKEQIFKTLTIQQIKTLLNIEEEYSYKKGEGYNRIDKYKIVTMKE